MRLKFQFGLKWFLLATTLIAVLIGTVGKRFYDQWQTDPVLELEELGVKVERRGDVIVKLHFPINKPEMPFTSRHFRMAAKIGKLEELRLSCTGFADADAPTLSAHSKLQMLTLSGNPGITDKALKSIAKIPSLTTLELGATGVTDEGLKDIARLPKLREFYLSSTPVTSRGLDHLLPMQSLQRLVLANTNVDDEGLAAIGKLRGLGVVTLSKTRVGGPGLVHLTKLPKLMLLELDGCSLQDGRGLAELKQVKYLRIWDAEISPGFLSHIHEMENLRHLDLSGSAINDQHLIELTNATQLTALSLGRHEYSYIHKGANDLNPRMSAAALNELRAKLPNTRIYGEPSNSENTQTIRRRMPQRLSRVQRQEDFSSERRPGAIAELEEIGVQVEDRDGVIVGLHFWRHNHTKHDFPEHVPKPRHFQLIAEFAALESLEVCNSGFGDSDCGIFLSHPKLKQLHVANNPGITDKALKTIAKVDSLEQLGLTGTGITDQGLVELARLPNLRILQLTNTAVSSRGMANLRPLQSLQMLSCDHTNIDDSGVSAIAELRGLVFIGLGHTQVRGRSLAMLAKLPKLQMLDLSGCSLEDASGLEELKQITHLQIGYSRIPPGFLSHLHAMDNLRELDLGGSTIADAQLLELATAKQLTHVTLNEAIVSKAAVQELRGKLNIQLRGEPVEP